MKSANFFRTGGDAPEKPLSITLRVSARRYRSAEQMAREWAGQDLPFVVRAFVGDLASAARRGRYCWQHELLAAWLERHPWPRREPEENL
ncbi:MAG: hypothetical protein ACREIA_23995 [Opitutaceae bacterium]